ncbi:MAG: amino acid ABC transporter permease [Promethearchaeota archaeon]
MNLTALSSNELFGILQIEQYYPDLLAGFSMMMELYLCGLLIGLGLGLVLAIGRHYGGPVTSRIAAGYIEFMRGTPLVVQILIIAILPSALNIWLQSQGLTPLNIRWQIVFPDIYGIERVILDTRILLCILTLGLNSAAYQAEFFRGALSSMSSGQTLAAQSIGMTKRQEIRHIALPQSLRRAIPAWSNEAVYLPKYTTIAYFVGVAEFFSMATLVVARTYQALLVYALEAIIFLVLISFISWLLNFIYQRIKIPGI